LTSSKEIKEKAFSVIYSRKNWLVAEHVNGPLLQKYNTTRLEVFEARDDNALFRHLVSEHSAKKSVIIDLNFKRGSMVIFDGVNHFMYYFPGDLMRIQ